MNQKGQNQKGQIVTGITVMVILIAFLALYLFFTPALHTIWGASENAAPANTPSSIYDNLYLVWPALMVVVIVLLIIWLFARAGRPEHEYSTFADISRELT